MKPLFDTFLMLVLMVMAWPSFANDAKPKPQVLITNVHVFDGVNEKRIENSNVLVEGNLIKLVSQKPIDVGGATVIDSGGRTLTPGFIDAHTHIMVNEPFEPVIYDRTQVYVVLLRQSTPKRCCFSFRADATFETPFGGQKNAS